MRGPVCCGTCATWQEPWALPNTTEDQEPSAKRVCVGLIREGHKLTLLLVWCGEEEYPEKGLSGHCPGPWLPDH